ncbi:hypothetical protein NDU88_006778 [Pleurodeles waltl]|uniref:Uncharacterized protein n=1 Tax=Pleurodeles waltl TaxID=8319 RepID=A0AAV7X1M6_PLEWA|nr:hypothetical protein NDU88_006778 [Pleurodeles waltl]
MGNSVRGYWEGSAGTGVASVPVTVVVPEVSTTTRELPLEEESKRHVRYLQEEETGNAPVAAVDPEDSEDEEAEDEDVNNSTSVIRQYFQ